MKSFCFSSTINVNWTKGISMKMVGENNFSMENMFSWMHGEKKRYSFWLVRWLRTVTRRFSKGAFTSLINVVFQIERIVWVCFCGFGWCVFRIFCSLGYGDCVVFLLFGLLKVALFWECAGNRWSSSKCMGDFRRPFATMEDWFWEIY